MIVKSSKVHRLNKNKLDKEKDLFLNTSQFLYNRNVFHDRKIDDKDEKLVYNINSIIIREDFLFNQDEVFIEDCDVKNIYFENNKNLGGITIPYNFIEKSKPLKIINKNKIKNRINKINIVFENETKTIDLKENYNFIYIGSTGLEGENMNISLSNNKGKIEYCIYNTGEIRKYLTEYKVTSWDLENDNLDLRKFLDYDIVTNQCIEEIKTIIIDKKTIKNSSIVKNFIYNNSSYFSPYYSFNIKKLHIVDDDDMRLIPKDKTYCMERKRNANVIDGYHYIYLGNKGNDVLIYIDKSNHLKIIEKNDILEDQEVENVYFNFDYIRDSISSHGRKISLILISYINGNHKIINFDEVFEINELFNKIILENAASLSLSPEIVNGLSNNNWVSVLGAYKFDNNMLVKMNELYNQYNNTIIELKNRGLSDRAIKYLCDKNYIKIFLENFEKIVENKEMISKEIETFNGLGDNYHKLVLKK